MLTFAKKHDMEKFTVRVYGLQELATCYFPGSTPQSASHRKQVAVIVDHIGEP